MPSHPFKQVDVFTAVPYLGNPLAVVLDGSGLTTEQMQHFTNWTNLSEATFLLPPTPEGAAAGADYRVRIFCPGRELPFAGHPTLGSCHAWLEAGGQPKAAHVVQECGAGLIRLRRSGTAFAAGPPQGEGAPPRGAATRAAAERGGSPLLAFAAPPLLKSGPLDEADVALIARGLGVPRSDILHHAWCDNGPNWRGVMLTSAEQVLALKPDGDILAGLDIGVVGQTSGSGAIAPRGKVGVVGATGDDAIAFEVRAFFPGNNGMAEDPVTGSLNAALAQWLIGAGLAPASYVASQGTALGRAGRVHVQQQGGDIWIGGGSVTCIDGTVML